MITDPTPPSPKALLQEEMQPGCIANSPERFLLILPVIGLFAVVLRCCAIASKQKKRTSSLSLHLRTGIKPSAVEILSVISMICFMTVGLTAEAILCRMECDAWGNFPSKWAFSINITAYAINYFLMFLKSQSVSKKTRRSDCERRLSKMFIYLAILNWAVAVATNLVFMTVTPYYEGGIERCSFTYEKVPALAGLTLYILLDLTVSGLGLYLFSKPLIMETKLKKRPAKGLEECPGAAPSSDPGTPRKLARNITARMRAPNSSMPPRADLPCRNAPRVAACPAPTPASPGPARLAASRTDAAIMKAPGGLRRIALWNLAGVLLGQFAFLFTAVYISVRTSYGDILVSGWATNYAYVLGVSVMFRDHEVAAALVRRAWRGRGRWAAAATAAEAVRWQWCRTRRRRRRVLPEFDAPGLSLFRACPNNMISMSARSSVGDGGAARRKDNENHIEEQDISSCCSERSLQEEHQIFPLAGISSPELYHISPTTTGLSDESIK